MLSILAKLFKVLNSEQSPGQIAAAWSLAAIIGMTPTLSLHNLFVLFIVLFFRVNLTMFLAAWPVFKIFGLLLEPASQALGETLLTAQSLASMWESFYNTLFGRWSNFYYTGVIGSLVIALAVALVVYPLGKKLVVKYRDVWMEKLSNLHVVKLLKASKFWQLYQQHAG